VTSYDQAEDAELVTKTVTVEGVTSVSVVPSEGSGNPSSRRDGIAVRFWCEACKAKPELLIEQSKGNTYVRWR
jgi:hypothetical protein